jgi:arsenate reductase (thioredoxin)
VEVTRFVTAVLLLLSTIAVLAQRGGSAPTSDSVVFVCEHGSVKSVVAAALFNQLATERGLQVRAIPRGTDPDSGIPQPVRQGMKAEGLAVDASFAPRQFTPSDFTAASHVVVFDVPMPSGEKVERWDGLPAFSAGYAAASAAMRERVERFVRRLAAK